MNSLTISRNSFKIQGERMTAPTPELKTILELVESELTAMLLAKEVGSVIIHCGRNDLAVEVTSKRKYEPVLLVSKMR